MFCLLCTLHSQKYVDIWTQMWLFFWQIWKPNLLLKNVRFLFTGIKRSKSVPVSDTAACFQSKLQKGKVGVEEH